MLVDTAVEVFDLTTGRSEPCVFVFEERGVRRITSARGRTAIPQAAVLKPLNIARRDCDTAKVRKPDVRLARARLNLG
jgi:hypothetical protein